MADTTTCCVVSFVLCMLCLGGCSQMSDQMAVSPSRGSDDGENTTVPPNAGLSESFLEPPASDEEGGCKQASANP